MSQRQCWGVEINPPASLFKCMVRSCQTHNTLPCVSRLGQTEMRYSGLHCVWFPALNRAFIPTARFPKASLSERNLKMPQNTFKSIMHYFKLTFMLAFKIYLKRQMWQTKRNKLIINNINALWLLQSHCTLYSRIKAKCMFYTNIYHSLCVAHKHSFTWQ